MVVDGRALEASAGERLVSSLLCADRLATSRSAKYRRARGPYCLRGDCGTCLMRVDGRSNRRACTEAAAPGRRLGSQNKHRLDAVDPSRLVDHAFSSGIDHHHLMVRPRLLNQAMQSIARELTGFGELPDAEAEAPSGHLHHRLAVLIVGAGPAGRGAAEVLAAAGVEHLVVDRRPRDYLRAPAAWDDPAPPPESLLCAGMFAAYPGEGIFAAHAETAPALHTFAAAAVILATGSRDPMIPLPNNDRPGVVSARGLLELMAHDALELEPQSTVVVGEGEHGRELAERLHARWVPAEEVADILGDPEVRALRTKTGERIPCRLVALAPLPAPAHELGVMAGAETHFDGHGFALVRDAAGRCGRMGASELWAAGELCGQMSPTEAHRDGRRVAKALLDRRAHVPEEE